MTNKRNAFYAFVVLVGIVFTVLFGVTSGGKMPKDNGIPVKDSAAKKIIFIHHSVGGHWLAHEGGGLVSALNRKGFYVNDITYGWQPRWLEDSSAKKIRNKIFIWSKHNPGGGFKIGDRTDIGHFYEWFVGTDSKRIMESVLRDNHETDIFGDHSNATSESPLKNPGENIENEVVIIKPCYPNSLYRGNGNDPPTTGDHPPRNFAADSENHTVGNCKRIFNDILGYFKQRPDKFFVIVAPPPRRELPDDGKTARAFTNWLVHDWLKENNHVGKNVMVFDLYNVLTSGRDWKKNDLGQEDGNHHRMWNGMEQHVVQTSSNVLTYPREGTDNHPSPAGLRKATHEFVDLFLFHYGNWKLKKQ